MPNQTQPASTDERQTLPLWPDAARILGIGRQAAFEAANRGEIPVLVIGRRKLVSKQALAALLKGTLK